jgi:hypothetical protein
LVIADPYSITAVSLVPISFVVPLTGVPKAELIAETGSP